MSNAPSSVITQQCDRFLLPRLATEFMKIIGAQIANLNFTILRELQSKTLGGVGSKIIATVIAPI
jgi:hypothetical protein